MSVVSSMYSKATDMIVWHNETFPTLCLSKAACVLYCHCLLLLIIIVVQSMGSDGNMQGLLIHDSIFIFHTVGLCTNVHTSVTALPLAISCLLLAEHYQLVPLQV